MRPLLCTLLSFLFINADAQRIDSLLKELQKEQPATERASTLAAVSFRIALRNPDTAFLLAKEALSLIPADNETQTLASCYSALGWSYFKHGRQDSAKFYLRKAATIFSHLKEYNDQAKTLANLSAIYQSEGNYNDVLKCLLEAQSLTRYFHNAATEGYIEKTLAITYRDQGEYEKARISFRRAIDICIETKDEQQLSDALGSLGSLYFKLNQPDSALDCYRQSLALSIKHNNSINIAICYENMGDAFSLKGEIFSQKKWYDSSLLSYQQAAEIFKSLNSGQDMAYEKMKIGQVLSDLKRYKEALTNLHEALAIFDSTKMYNYSAEAVSIMSRTYKAAGDYKNAAIYMERMLAYNDTINTQKKNEAIASMLAKFETEKKDREIELLNVKNSLSAKEVTRLKTVVTFSIISALLLVLLVILLFARNRIKQELKEATVRNQLAADLHDDIGSSLSSILLMSKMAQEQSTENKSYLVSKIGNNAKDVIDKIDEIVWTINPRFDEGISLADRIESHAEEIKQMSGLAINLHIDENISQLKLNMNVRKNLYLIFKESMNNIIKHANASAVDVELKQEEKELVLQVKDNGVGFEKDNSTNGNGMETMVMRATACGGKSNIISAPGKGTIVTIRIPITHSRYKKN